MDGSTPSPLSVRRDSRPIAKVRPKIRIIHIFAPEIIKTDAADFRELVQRLTGKPTPNPDQAHVKPAGSSKKKRPKVPRKLNDDPAGSMANLHDKPSMITRKMEPFGGLISNTTSQHEDYFSGFSDIDRFIQDISELPLLPLDPFHHSHSSFEASQLS
ncbi:hypothetical protein CDL15_Pgr003137 [Punica granatum]|nr:hypothetical protein CDL15_Pgr003137 [Punica granatum]